MAEKSKSPETGPDLVETLMSATNELHKTGLGSLSWLGSDWLENFSDLGAEMLTFMADRVREDVRTQHQLLHARDLSEVQKIQTQFLQDAVDQYAAETGKLVKMSNELAEKTRPKN